MWIHTNDQSWLLTENKGSLLVQQQQHLCDIPTKDFSEWNTVVFCHLWHFHSETQLQLFSVKLHRWRWRETVHTHTTWFLASKLVPCHVPQDLERSKSFHDCIVSNTSILPPTCVPSFARQRQDFCIHYRVWSTKKKKKNQLKAQLSVWEMQKKTVPSALNQRRSKRPFSVSFFKMNWNWTSLEASLKQ